MRKTLTAAALVAGLGLAGFGSAGFGGILAVAEAGQEPAVELVPVAGVQPTGHAGIRLETLHARAEAHELQYEPSKRDREGDDDDEDEPRH